MEHVSEMVTVRYLLSEMEKCAMEGCLTETKSYASETRKYLSTDAAEKIVKEIYEPLGIEDYIGHMESMIDDRVILAARNRSRISDGLEPLKLGFLEQ